MSDPIENDAVIWKILTPDQWSNFQREGVFRGSPVDIADGYIHFSTESQLQGTLEKHYPGQDDVQLVRVDTAQLGDQLKWERSRNDELFPHLYAELPWQAVLDSFPRSSCPL